MSLTRTETGPVLPEAMHLFLNQTNLIDWGKSNYPPGENGGIAGIVFYAFTRAENDPRIGVGAWEPGIPRVQVNLYRTGLSTHRPPGRTESLTISMRMGDCPDGRRHYRSSGPRCINSSMTALPQTLIIP